MVRKKMKDQEISLNDYVKLLNSNLVYFDAAIRFITKCINQNKFSDIRRIAERMQIRIKKLQEIKEEL